VRRALDTKVLVARIAIGTLLALALVAAAAYAAAGRGGRHGKERHEPAAATTSPTSPVTTQGSGALRIPGHPPAISTQSNARFRVASSGETMLRCRLDKRPAQDCDESLVLYRGVGTGTHTFSVQSIRSGRVAARASFVWLVLEPKPFTVSPRPESIGPLYPGEPASPIPVVITNPNPVPITITALKVTASGGTPGCTPAENVALTAPALAGGKLRLAAHASVSLPSAKVPAPTIALRELPVSQDSCKNANFRLTFSGSAGG
jgi:hypothetical protein